MKRRAMTLENVRIKQLHFKSNKKFDVLTFLVLLKDWSPSTDYETMQNVMIKTSQLQQRKISKLLIFWFYVNISSPYLPE